MNRSKAFLFALLVCVCLLPPRAEETEPKTSILLVLENQRRAWNEGDLERFMEGYAKNDQLRFASEGTVHRGWEATLGRYQNRYPDRAAMGHLQFSELDVTLLSPDAALVFGRWRLESGGQHFGGLFTLLARKLEEGWRIVHDHTSSGPN